MYHAYAPHLMELFNEFEFDGRTGQKHPYSDLAIFNSVVLRLAKIMGKTILLTPDMIDSESRGALPIWVHPEPNFTGRVMTVMKVSLHAPIISIMSEMTQSIRTSIPFSVLITLREFRDSIRLAIGSLSEYHPGLDMSSDRRHNIQINIKTFMNYWYGRYGQPGSLITGEVCLTKYVSEKLIRYYESASEALNVGLLLYYDTDVAYFAVGDKSALITALGDTFKYTITEVPTCCIFRKKCIIEIDTKLDVIVFNDHRYTRCRAQPVCDDYSQVFTQTQPQ